MIRLIFTKLLDICAWSTRFNNKFRQVPKRLTPERNPGLPRERIQKTPARTHKTIFRIALKLDAKAPVNDERALLYLVVRRQRHDGKRLVWLCADTWENTHYAQQK